MESILESIKKMLGPSAQYDYFDPDIIVHINTAFMTLRQLGVGPVEGFSISDKNAVWADFLSDNKNLEGVKTYLYMKVKIIFDPPSGSHLEALKESIAELEWRLNAEAESV